MHFSIGCHHLSHPCTLFFFFLYMCAHECKVNSRLLAPVRHEVMVEEMKNRGNACLKKKDFSGAVAAYTSALGQGLWVEQALELVEAGGGRFREHSAPTTVETTVQKGEKIGQGAGRKSVSNGQDDSNGDSGSDDDDDNSNDDDEDVDDEEEQEEEEVKYFNGPAEVPFTTSGRFGSTQEAFEALTAKNSSEHDDEAANAAVSSSKRRGATIAAAPSLAEVSPEAQASAERDLLVSHAKTAAALLANRSLANLRLGRAADALRDARLAKR
jgi:Zn ribbon nucleic-acid-binding protein